MPGLVDEVRVVAWLTDGAVDLGFEVSADDKEFKPVAVERKEQRFPPVPLGPAGGKRRTLVDYRAAANAMGAAGCLRIQWRGPAELDRVEVYYK